MAAVEESVLLTGTETDNCNGVQDVNHVNGQEIAHVTNSEAESHLSHGDHVVAQEHLHDESPVIDIHINNVVSNFNSRCHLNLRHIATEGMNVIYKRENGMLNMKLRNPEITASIWSSGKVTCTGATSEDEAKIASKRIARCLQKLGFKVRFTNYRVVNVLGTCILPFGIRINAFSQAHPQDTSYEPEIHPGATYKIKKPKATLKIFSTGSITVTAPSVANVSAAIEHIYPLVEPYKMERPRDSIQGAMPGSTPLPQLRRQGKHAHPQVHSKDYDSAEDEEFDSDVSSEGEDFDSDVSQD